MKAILNSRFPFKDAYLCMKQCCVKKLQPFCSALHIHKCMFLCIVFRHRGVRCDKKKTIELHCFRRFAALLADWSQCRALPTRKSINIERSLLCVREKIWRAMRSEKMTLVVNNSIQGSRQGDNSNDRDTIAIKGSSFFFFVQIITLT